MNRICADLILVLILLSSPVWVVAQPFGSSEPVKVMMAEQDNPGWREVTSVEDFYAAHPERMEFILQNLNLEQEGLEKVRQAYESGNLKIIPAGTTSWSIDFVKGQEEPAVQGWYSKEYNIYEPNTTTIYTGRVKSDDAFVWVLFPSEEAAPEVKAEVLSQDSNAVKVRVSIPEKGYWNISVPFLNSAEAGVEFVTDGH